MSFRRWAEISIDALGMINAERRSMALGLPSGQATFRLLATFSFLERDRVWTSVTRRRRRAALRSDGRVRQTVLSDDGVLLACLLVFVGLALLVSVLTLLFWVAGTVPPNLTRSCPEFELCPASAPDGDESLSVNDAVTAGMTQ